MGHPNNLEDVRDTLRAHVRRLSDALWELDSASSLRRKAEQGGYRSSETTGDSRWNVASYAQREADAYLVAVALLGEAGLYHVHPPKVPGLLGRDRTAIDAMVARYGREGLLTAISDVIAGLA